MDKRSSGHLFDTIDFLFAVQKAPLDYTIASIWDLVASSRSSSISREDLSRLLRVRFISSLCASSNN